MSRPFKRSTRECHHAAPYSERLQFNTFSLIYLGFYLGETRVVYGKTDCSLLMMACIIRSDPTTIRILHLTDSSLSHARWIARKWTVEAVLEVIRIGHTTDLHDSFVYTRHKIIMQWLSLLSVKNKYS